MLFCKDFLFIHVPKTGGMSATGWLLNNYMGEMFLSVPANARDHAVESFEFPDVRERVTIIDGKRHETLAEAEKLVGEYGFKLADFKAIVAVARHPYQLERSYHTFLQKPAVTNLRSAASGPGSEVDYAKNNSLVKFIKYCTYYGDYPSRIEDYFEIDGVMPPNMQIVKMESFADDLARVFGPFVSDRKPLERRNQSTVPETEAAGLDDDLVDALVRKQPYLCKLYGVSRKRTLSSGVLAAMSLPEFEAAIGSRATENQKEAFVKLVELIEKSAKGRDFNPVETTEILKSVFATINQELDENNQIGVAHFGVFRKRKGDSREDVFFRPVKSPSDSNT